MNQFYYTKEARDLFFNHLREIGFVDVLLDGNDGGLIFTFADIVKNYIDFDNLGFKFTLGESLNFFDIEMLAEQIHIDHSHQVDIDLKARLMEIYTILDEKFKAEKLLSSDVKPSKDMRF
ncbi:TPA: hypothetical protein QDB40_004865 [Burkholderia vietnamiensis]|uniref:hypothetical protein n=1 Tax=Burkholderia cepacia complex TaxID=87882 RepID=UPI0015944145|nr:hypothetical protein [Burkholderia vietnamiensis]HDR9102666.1 hypothetical protein [Burkholderia vietnamiensis]HDR9170832.1 hypothetical protein [Burkholderia vietnamiensis]